MCQLQTIEKTMPREIKPVSPVEKKPSRGNLAALDLGMVENAIAPGLGLAMAEKLNLIQQRARAVPAGGGVIQCDGALGLTEAELQALNDQDLRDGLESAHTKMQALAGGNTSENRREALLALKLSDSRIYSHMNAAVGGTTGKVTFGQMTEAKREAVYKAAHQTEIKRAEAVAKVMAANAGKSADDEGFELPFAPGEDMVEADIAQAKQIWARLTGEESKIKFAEGQTQEYKDRIYGHLSKMMEYRTGREMLSLITQGNGDLVFEQKESDAKATSMDTTKDGLKMVSGEAPEADRARYMQIGDLPGGYFAMLRGKAGPQGYLGVKKPKVGGGFDYFKMGEGTGSKVNFDKDLPIAGMRTTGEGEVEAFTPRWMVFAHEMGHALAHMYGAGYDSDGLLSHSDMASNEGRFQLQAEEFRNVTVFENPLRQEAGLRTRGDYRDISQLLADVGREPESIAEREEIQRRRSLRESLYKVSIDAYEHSELAKACDAAFPTLNSQLARLYDYTYIDPEYPSRQIGRLLHADDFADPQNRNQISVAKVQRWLNARKKAQEPKKESGCVIS